MNVTFLNGPLTTLDHAPKLWRNDAPLLFEDGYQMQRMVEFPLADFPEIVDFEVVIGKWTDIFGCRPYFYGFTRGFLAEFPYWKHAERDLVRDDFVIPIGDLNAYYHDPDLGWEILIGADDEFVYVLGGSDQPYMGYSTWFKVQKQRYLTAWQEAIELCKTTFLG